MLPLRRNKVPGWIKQGGGPDSAHGPCVCLLWSRGFLPKSMADTPGESVFGFPIIDLQHSPPNINEVKGILKYNMSSVLLCFVLTLGTTLLFFEGVQAF